MNRALIALAVASLLAGLRSPLTAQELSEEDIFNTEAFEQIVAESRQEEKTDTLEYLIGGIFLANGTAAATTAFDGYTASGAFSGKAFVRMSVPSYGSLYLGYNFDHTFFQGTTDPILAATTGRDLFANSFRLSEFYLGFDLAKILFFRIGNQLVAWGPSVIWTPVDFINLERIDPQASVDLRVGKPGLRIHLPLKSSNLFLFTDFSSTVTSETLAVTDLADTTNLALRWDLILLGFELGLSGYIGRSVQSRAGFDFSGRLLGFDAYGELALAIPDSDADFAYAFSVGLQRALGELKDWTVQGEFFYNSLGVEELPADGFTPFYVGKMYVFAGIGKQNLFADFLDVSLSGFLNASDLSYSIKLASTFDLTHFIPFAFSLGYNGGGGNKEFTSYTGNNALSASLQVRFEF